MPFKYTVLFGRRSYTATVMLARGNVRSPQLAIKVDWSGGPRRRLEREYQTLLLARRQLPWSISRDIPVPLAFRNSGQAQALVTTVVAGTRVTLPSLVRTPSAAKRRRLGRHVGAVRQWSRRLAGSTMHTSGNEPRRTTRVVEAFLEHFDHGPQGLEEMHAWERALASRQGLYRGRWQHGDVAHGNALYHAGKLSFIDWEAASPNHPPWTDDAYLILSLARTCQAELGVDRVSTAMRRGLGAGTWAGEALKRIYAADWPYTITIADAVLHTVISQALGPDDQEALEPHWVDLAIDLLTDWSLREECCWLAPSVV